MSLEFNPTPVPSPEVYTNQDLDKYYLYLKDLDKNGEPITEYDLRTLYHLFETAGNFTPEKIENLFGLLERLAITERFETAEVAENCLNTLASYRKVLGL